MSNQDNNGQKENGLLIAGIGVIVLFLLLKYWYVVVLLVGGIILYDRVKETDYIPEVKAFFKEIWDDTMNTFR